MEVVIHPGGKTLLTSCVNAAVSVLSNKDSFNDTYLTVHPHPDGLSGDRRLCVFANLAVMEEDWSEM